MGILSNDVELRVRIPEAKLALEGLLGAIEFAEIYKQMSVVTINNYIPPPICNETVLDAILILIAAEKELEPH